MKKFIIGFLTGVIFLSVSLGIFLLYKNKKTLLPNCNFDIVDLEEHKGEYYPGSNYIIYEGVIKNNSDVREYLKGFIAKIYNDENVLLSSGYTTIEDWVEGGKALPFKIQTQINTKYNTVIRKYFNKGINLKPDVYPWFLTCK